MSAGRLCLLPCSKLSSCSCFNVTEVLRRLKACLTPNPGAKRSASVLATKCLHTEISHFKNCMFQKAWSCVVEDSLGFMSGFNARVAVLAWTLGFLIHKLSWHLLIRAIYFSTWQKPELCITSPQVFFLVITWKGAAVYWRNPALRKGETVYARLGSEGEAYICSSSILKRTWKIRVARSNFILCNKLIATFNPMCHLQLQAMSSRAFSAA